MLARTSINFLIATALGIAASTTLGVVYFVANFFMSMFYHLSGIYLAYPSASFGWKGTHSEYVIYSIITASQQGLHGACCELVLAQGLVLFLSVTIFFFAFRSINKKKH